MAWNRDQLDDDRRRDRDAEFWLTLALLFVATVILSLVLSMST